MARGTEDHEASVRIGSGPQKKIFQFFRFVVYLLKENNLNNMMTLKSIKKISPKAAAQVRLGWPSYMEVGIDR